VRHCRILMNDETGDMGEAVVVVRITGNSWKE
jgi:hypothetical protein